MGDVAGLAVLYNWGVRVRAAVRPYTISQAGAPAECPRVWRRRNPLAGRTCGTCTSTARSPGCALLAQLGPATQSQSQSRPALRPAGGPRAAFARADCLIAVTFARARGTHCAHSATGPNTASSALPPACCGGPLCKHQPNNFARADCPPQENRSRRSAECAETSACSNQPPPPPGSTPKRAHGVESAAPSGRVLARRGG